MKICLLTMQGLIINKYSLKNHIIKSKLLLDLIFQ